MAIFKDNPDEWQRLDYRILQNGWTSLYWQQAVLDSDLGWFKTENFKIIDLDCITWVDENNIHKDLKKQLEFPDYYGENLNALNDCLSDVDIPEPGLVVVFRQFQNVEKRIAHDLLDIFANNSRRHLLFGRKLLTLAQVSNPNYEMDSVGCCAVLWNGAEWLASKRVQK